MKTTFIGGGAHRLVLTLRAALEYPEVFAEGEIYLHDLNVPRAEAVGRILRQTPEYRRNPVTIRWGDSLPEALEGASVVSVILMAGSLLSYERGSAESFRHGFWGASDNVSPNGALLAAKGAPILRKIASEMERLCPDAWLLDFANPAGVLSGMINRHTKIKALGVCAGFTNYQWDLTRIFGRNEWGADFEVRAAGINHLSLILDGTRRGRDLFSELDRLFDRDWKLPVFDPPLPPITNRALEKLVRFYCELGILIYSTELDGMIHLFYDEEVQRASSNIPSEDEISALVEKQLRQRQEKNAWFEAHADRELDDAFWNQQKGRTVFSKNRDDIFVRILKGISGLEPVDIVTSRLNEGAIAGFSDDLAVEYSQRLYRNTIRPAGRFVLPPVVHGLIHSLAVHQTLLGDACYAEDPRLLAHALLAYPMKSHSSQARSLYRSLITINEDELPASLRQIDPSLQER